MIVIHGTERDVCGIAPQGRPAAEVVVAAMSAVMILAAIQEITAATIVVAAMSAAITFAVLLATIVVTA